jgi:kumamolisin
MRLARRADGLRCRARGHRSLVIACSLLLPAAAGVSVGLGSSGRALRAPAAHQVNGAPGTLVGPATTAPVSFLALLRSGTRPSCLLRWARAAHLAVGWAPGQHWASISGQARVVDRDFDVTVEDYRGATGANLLAANRQATVPSASCGEVAGIGAIHSFVQPTTFGVPAGGLSNVELLRAYDALPLVQQGYDGQGETVVFVEVSGFEPADLTDFASAEHLGPYSVSLLGKNTGGTDETPMDIETVHEIAPGAHLVFLNLTSVTGATS